MLHSSGQAQKKPSPILGVKWGGGMDKMWKQGANVRISQPCGRNLDHFVATTLTRNRYIAYPQFRCRHLPQNTRESQGRF
jgi:hypothetical protein